MNDTKLKIGIIAALAKEGQAIGKDNRLLWDIPEDMRHFRELTTGHTVIMGQKTYESIGRPLPNRTNIVMTLDRDFCADDGCHVVYSIDEALHLAHREEGSGEVFVIGGGSIYEQFLSLADRLYLTLVEGKFDGDVFFPDYSEFSSEVERRKSFDDLHQYEFLILER